MTARTKARARAEARARAGAGAAARQGTDKGKEQDRDMGGGRGGAPELLRQTGSATLASTAAILLPACTPITQYSYIYHAESAMTRVMNVSCCY